MKCRNSETESEIENDRKRVDGEGFNKWADQKPLNGEGMIGVWVTSRVICLVWASLPHDMVN